ncbi:hypothetical protein JB92DRAFT_3088505 [Gautieria morchelliformis]|nr:hypothetical protein JB92DRAFT_3088505 [Gautieria morchelliformis]
MAPTPTSAVGNFPSCTPPTIWWSNSMFFIATHLGALYGVFYISPFSVTSNKSLVLALVLWQLSCFGITIGYHRLYSHRAFQAPLGVRVVLAILGSMAFQGSIKWWCLRHRLHHRFTDDPVHDPYSASRGLFYSHMGWIFFKPSYSRMASVDRSDLEKDAVVRYQHKNYLPLAFFFGIVAPTLIGWTWADASGALVWAGLVARVITWHCTFLVNSFAHWDGLQKYTDEVSARGNTLMALWSCGEGNHNFHAFPYDFRAGPALLDWDPSKWIIQGLYRLRLASRLRRARDQDIEYAMQYMQRKQKQRQAQPHREAHFFDADIVEAKPWKGPTWNRLTAQKHILTQRERCFILLDDFLLDVTTYMKEHPGGATLLRTYSLRAQDDFVWQDANWAFLNLNNHSEIARRRLQEMIVAKVPPS